MEQIFFGLGAFCTVLLGVIMYVFIMVIRHRSELMNSKERVDFVIRQIEDFSSSSWRMREDLDRSIGSRIDRMEIHAYEHMSKIETRVENLEKKMIPSDAPKHVIKG